MEKSWKTFSFSNINQSDGWHLPIPPGAPQQASTANLWCARSEDTVRNNRKATRWEHNIRNFIRKKMRFDRFQRCNRWNGVFNRSLAVIGILEYFGESEWMYVTIQWARMHVVFFRFTYNQTVGIGVVAAAVAKNPFNVKKGCGVLSPRHLETLSLGKLSHYVDELYDFRGSFRTGVCLLWFHLFQK